MQTISNIKDEQYPKDHPASVNPFFPFRQCLRGLLPVFMSFCGEEVQVRRLFDVPSMGNMIT